MDKIQKFNIILSPYVSANYPSSWLLKKFVWISSLPLFMLHEPLVEKPDSINREYDSIIAEQNAAK
jgi:hypothetical protein